MLRFWDFPLERTTPFLWRSYGIWPRLTFSLRISTIVFSSVLGLIHLGTKGLTSVLLFNHSSDRGKSHWFFSFYSIFYSHIPKRKHTHMHTHTCVHVNMCVRPNVTFCGKNDTQYYFKLCCDTIPERSVLFMKLKTIFILFFGNLLPFHNRLLNTLTLHKM